jgi:hypothetical protein
MFLNSSAIFTFLSFFLWYWSLNSVLARQAVYHASHASSLGSVTFNASLKKEKAN